MSDAVSMLLGAGLVSVGVIASAVADRIRGLRASKTMRDSLERPEPRAKRASGTPARGVPPVSVASVVPAPSATGADEIVEALTASGYTKAVAVRAVAACTAREKTSPEVWLAAAFRHAVIKS